MKVHEDVFVRLRVISIIADPYFQSINLLKTPAYFGKFDRVCRFR